MSAPPRSRRFNSTGADSGTARPGSLDRARARARASSTSYDLPTIISLAEDGVLRLPQFQRSFVWKASDVLQLFDSIYRGFPIGTLLLWQRNGEAGEIFFGPVTFSSEQRSDALWVVDGQQRITSLVASLYSTEAVDEFRVFFDLAREKFIGPVRGARPRRSIPVHQALESRSLLSWLRDHEDELEEEDLNTADALGGALRDYDIPAYLVKANDELLLREIFDRVNKSGKPLSRADIFHALFVKSTEPGSPASVADELAHHRFGRISDNRILQSLLAIRGGDVQRDIRHEWTEEESPADWYDRTTEALTRVILFLQSQGVPHQALMPSAFPLPVLAAFFHLHPEPAAWHSAWLAKWLWRGWVHGFGAESGQTPMLRKSIRAVNPEHLRPEKGPEEYLAVKALVQSVRREPPNIPKLNSFSAKTAEAKLVTLALVSLGPRVPDSGELVDLPAIFEEFGTGAIGELVPDARSDGAARGIWLPTWKTLTGHEAPEILRSHAVNESAAQALRTGDISAFLEHRRRELTELVGGFLNQRVDLSAPLRPSLATMSVPDQEGSDPS